MTTYTGYVNDIYHNFVTRLHWLVVGFRLYTKRPMSFKPKKKNYNVMDIHCSGLHTFSVNCNTCGSVSNYLVIAQGIFSLSLLYNVKH
jgi:hypothetical protein